MSCDEAAMKADGETCEHGGMRLLAAAALLVMGCGAGPVSGIAKAGGAADAAHVVAVEGYALTFPGPVQTRSGHDGPSAFRIDAGRTADGARFEAAWFGFPEALDEPDRAALLARVERGLAGDAGSNVRSRGLVQASGREAVDLVIDRADGQRGFHRVLYPSPRAMLQVSAVGPEGGDWEGLVPAFYASLVVEPAATP